MQCIVVLLRQAVSQPAFASVLERAASACASAVLPDGEPSSPWIEQKLDGPLLLRNVVDLRGWRDRDSLAGNYSVPVQLSPVRHMPVKYRRGGAWHAVSESALSTMLRLRRSRPLCNRCGPRSTSYRCSTCWTC